MKRRGKIVFSGGLFRCQDCHKAFTSLFKAEEHRHAKQKQKDTDKTGERTHPKDKGDEVCRLLTSWPKRMP